MRIFKYEIHNLEQQYVDLPAGAKFLTLQLQGDKCVFWAEINPKTTRLERHQLVTYMTGQDIPQNPGGYLGTYQLRGIVCHVYISHIGEI